MLQRLLCRQTLLVPRKTATVSRRRLASSLVQRRVNVPVGCGTAAMAVPLTVADLHLRHEQLPFAYFFNETLDAQALQESLTTVLQQEFAVAGGRLSPCFRSITCTPNDTIPLSFFEMDCSLAEWQATKDSQGHKHQSGRGDHPHLLPLFDSLFPKDKNQRQENQANLLSVRVTYFSCGATCLGVNMNHCLADTASCVHFVQVWGNEMRQAQRRRRDSEDSTRRVCWERAKAAVSGMMTADTAELMGLVRTKDQASSSSSSSSSWKLPLWFTTWIPNESVKPDDPLIDHEYVALEFTVPVLKAMKAHGMVQSKGDDFVSTNDMVTAVGWLLKRFLSQERSWNISVVVNLRGRCGVGTFTDAGIPRTGLFGNAITSVVAHMEPTPETITGLRKRDARAAAHSIRQALQQALLVIPDQLARSRLGIRNEVVPSMNTFSTTSWGQLTPWSISFGDKANVSAFHGQPAHPLPVGRTFASVIHSAVDGTCTYELFLPSDQADQARQLHAQLCCSYMDWYAEQNQTLKHVT